MGEEYSLSLWARGGEAAQRLTVGFEALFGAPVADCPSGERGPCSYTPQNVSLDLGEWARHELVAKCRFAPDKTGGHIA